MGMFDWVNYEMECPNCKHSVDGFQSKDKDCTLSTVEVGVISNFYTHCSNCDTWIEFNLNKDKVTIDDYIMTTRKTIQHKEEDEVDQ